MNQPPVDDLDQATTGFESRYGLRLLECSEERVRAEVTVRNELKQPAGLVHGGLYAALAETIATLGTVSAVARNGATAVGQCTSTSFLRPITAGSVHAEARPRHRGRTTWLWDVEITNDAGRLCVVSRVTIAVRPPAR